jgi:hypothetical protein
MNPESPFKKGFLPFCFQSEKIAAPLRLPGKKLREVAAASLNA